MRLLIIILLFLTSCASVPDGQERLYGTWSGFNTLPIQITPSSIVLHIPQDVPSANLPIKFNVRYRHLGNEGTGDDSYVAEFIKDGKRSGSIMFFVKDRDHILMDFPGQGAYPLMRVAP